MNDRRARPSGIDKGQDQPQQMDLAARAGLVEDTLQLRAGGVDADVEFFAALGEARTLGQGDTEPQFSVT